MINDDRRQDFKRNLLHLMYEKGVLEADIARNLSVAQSTVSCWTRGKCIPRGSTLIKLASMLGVTTSMLLKSNTSFRDSLELSEEECLLGLYRNLTMQGKKIARAKMYELSTMYWYGKEKNVL